MTASTCGHRVAVGLPHTLGHAGGPRRVHEQRVVAVEPRLDPWSRARGGPAPASTSRPAPVVSSVTFSPATSRSSRVASAGRVTMCAGAGVEDRVPQRRIGEQVVERDGHAARLPDAEQRRHVLQRVGQEEPDPVARRRGPRRAGRRRTGPRCRRGGRSGPPSLVEPQRHLARVVGGDAPQQGRDVHSGSSTTASA